MSALLAEAIAWHQAGYTPVPARADGSKAPGLTTWREWQHTQPPIGTVIDWFAHTDTDGLGLLCGATSGGLVMIEFEGRAVDEGYLDKAAQAFADHDALPTWERITTGYAERTPSGGIHLYVRVPVGRTPGNTRLARRPSTDTELAAHPGQRVQVLIETRGQGGYTVIAPSAGRTHPTGKAWEVVAGEPRRIPGLSQDDLELALAVLSTLDQMPAANTTAPAVGSSAARPNPSGTVGGVRPGDDYNQRTRWADILTPRGWTLAWQRGRLCGWTRPGKHLRDGISATTGRNDADNLYVFSSSTEFETEQPYDKFGALALLEHGGDIAAAAKALAEAGYGTAATPADPDPVRIEDLIDPTPASIPAASNVLQFPPAAVQPATSGTAALQVTQPVATVTDLTLARYGQTEDGVARALVDLFADVLRYCPQRGLWLTWNGARWEWDEREHHREHAKRLARTLPDNDLWRRFRTRALSASGVAGIINLARTDPKVTIHLDDLDAHPWQLNTPGGIIDMRTGTLTPADRHALHSRTTTATPDYNSAAPVWERFLADTFGGDVAMIGFVQRLLGLSAVGQVVEQQLPFAFGPGANGKSTLMNVVMKILGRGRDGYSIALDAEALMVRRHSEHPAELAQLAGARMVISSEIEDGQRFAEARVKQLTGGDAISARFMRGNPFTFTPTHTLWLVGNHKPGTTAGGPAFWRRIKLIPFDHTVPEERRDPHLEDKLAAEAPQILAWIARGAAAYAAHGLGTPDAVTAATAAYRDDQDSVAKFIGEACMKTREGRVKVAELRAAYERFCRDSGDAPVSPKRFGEQLRDSHGITLGRDKASRYYAGVMLYATDDEPERTDWRDR